MIVSVSIGYADCRMFAMFAHMGKDLTTINNNNNFLTDCLEELQDQGGSGSSHPYWNDDGWGLIYYLDGNMLQDGIFRGTEQAYGSTNYDAAQTTIEGAQAHLTMGHVRKSTNITGIDDPHPFIFHTPNTDYSFMHNGSVDSLYFKSLINVLAPSWLVYHPITQYPGGTVDSEYLFSWIMLNIHLNNYNVFAGLIDAIKGMAPLSGEDRTFILTDGIDLYCYKNSYDYEVDHDLHYTWRSVENELGFWTVMSLFPSAHPLSQAMVNDELLYLSPTGQKVSIRDCSNQDGLVQHNRQLYAGWNWESFAILPAPPVNGADILDYLETHGEITEVEGPNELYAVYNSVTGWYPASFPFDDVSLYKLNMTSGTNPVHCPCFNTIGYLRDSSQPLLENIQGYQYYWVGYDLMPSQRIDDAFGDEWSNVRGIRGEDWSYSRKDRGGRPVVPCWSPVGKYLEFGKGYIVSFWDDMPSFRWHNRHFLFSDIPHSKRAETFTFEEKSDYLSIDILENGSREEILEIGAFQDGECIGAVGVICLPVQLQAYSDPNGGEISFEVYTGDRSALRVTNYQVMDILTGEMKEGVITPGKTEFAIVKLGDMDNIQSSIFNIQLSNYPNPFNPSTTISFSIPEEGRVELTIYNTKGQKVKTFPNLQINKSSNQQIIWNGRDDNDNQVSSGIYLYKLNSNNTVVTKRMLLMK